MRALRFLILTLAVIPGAGAAQDPEPDEPPPAELPAPGPDQIYLTNGSMILGEIVDMTGGVLTVKTPFGISESVKIQWKEVAGLQTERAHVFSFPDGSRITGQVVRTENGRAVLTSETVIGEVDFPIDSVSAINPPLKKEIELVGTLALGTNITDGNTQTKTATIQGNAVAQSEKQRLTLRAAWNYAEDSGGVTARNTRGTAKYDYFVTERFFLFTSILLEEDEFQDLNLRTAVSGGPGYQFIKKGDYTSWWLQGLEYYAEAGIAYFNEDHEVGPDDQYISGRWSMRVDWPLNSRFTLFHYHEGYPSLERASDLYITSEQGIRFSIFENFVGTFQVNWRWDSTPSPGFEKTDVMYLATIGYQFRL